MASSCYKVILLNKMNLDVSWTFFIFWVIYHLFYCKEFGAKWFWEKLGEVRTTLNPVKYLESPKNSLNVSNSFLFKSHFCNNVYFSKSKTWSDITYSHWGSDRSRKGQMRTSAIKNKASWVIETQNYMVSVRQKGSTLNWSLQQKPKF